MNGNTKFGLSQWTIGDLTSVFRRYPNVSRVLLFGSRAKGDYRAGSDIDLAVVGDGIGDEEMMRMRCDIDDLGLLYGVDLLCYDKVGGTPIASHIDRVGKVLYEREKMRPASSKNH